jgi:hypothetical protein
VERLDSAYEEQAVRARSAEERHVVTGPGHDVLTADELADTGSSDAGLERARGQRDDLAFRCVEPRAGRVDAENAAPHAGCPGRVLRPALLTAAEQIGLERATTGAENQETDCEGEAAPSE